MMGVLGATPTLAQVGDPPPPPRYQAVDANGVDLMSGQLSIGSQPVNSIGDGPGGLTASETVRYGTPVSGQYSYVKLLREGTFAASFSTTVVLLGQTETFTGIPPNAMPDSFTSGKLEIDGADIVYTKKDGTVARFDKVTLGTTGPASRTGYLKSVVYPSGEKLTVDMVYGGNQLIESSLGYAMTGSAYGGTWRPLAANLKNGGCSGASCTGTTYADQASLGRSLTSTISGSTLTLNDPAGGAAKTYVVNSDGRVVSFSNGYATWTYGYVLVIDSDPQDGILTTTATDPLGHTRVVKARLSNQHIISDTNGVGKTTTFQYSGDASLVGAGLLTSITWPEGNKSRYEYDGDYNVTAKYDDPKPGSGLTPSVVRAAYGGTCATSKVCDKPDWVKDARGAQTDFTYDPVHGGVLTATQPAGPNGVRPQTRYTYAQFTARYVRGGVMQAAAAPVWRVTQTSTCAVGAAPACVGTADETVTSYAYEDSSQPNNVRLLSTTVRSGDNVLIATTRYAYNDRGDTITVDGPLPGTADTTRTYYDASRWKTGQIGPDPDGSGPLLNRATKSTYDADGRVILAETGTATSQADNAMSSFSALQQTYTAYDVVGDKRFVATVGGGATQSVTQYDYNTAGGVICAVERMNPATFASPPGSACTLATAGADGPDRITYTQYDAADRVTQVTSGYGTSGAYAPRIEKVVTYTDNGKEKTLADGKGNLTTYEYDGLDRLAKVRYPSPTTAGSSSTSDYETYGYDAAGNRTSLRRRDGQTVSFTFDALNRTTTKSLPSTAYVYDNLGRQLSATSGDQVIGNSYDALGRTISEYGAYGTYSYQYDLAGARTRITWPDGFYAAYDHDVTGAVTAIRENGAASGLGVLASYSYDNLGRPVGVLRGNGNQTTYGYDAASRLASLGIDLGGTTYDQTYAFTYNASSQVKSRSVANVVYDWPFDATSRTYAANGLNQLTVTGSLSLAYDARGNLTSDGAATYAYDVENHLTSASSGLALRYDPTGRLMETRTSPTAATWLRYAGADLVAEYDSGGAGALLRRYVPGPGGDQPVIWYEGSGSGDRRWLFADAQGSVVAASNNAGSAILINLYDEYGVPGPSNLGRYQYTGQTWIPELGFYHYKARVYSPTLGRFLQTDPTGYDDGLNWYAYVGNDPLNRSDPTGTMAMLENSLDSFGEGVELGGKKPPAKPPAAPKKKQPPKIIYRIKNPDGTYTEVSEWVFFALCPTPKDCQTNTQYRTSQPPLSLLHTPESMGANGSSRAYWESRSTEEIVNSLRPGSQEPLITYPNGRVAQGNTRVLILIQRGYNVDSLPRTPR